MTSKSDIVLEAMSAPAEHARGILVQVMLAMEDCERRAFTCLAANDYTGFGAYASRWSMLARMQAAIPPSPFRELVNMAKATAAINLRKESPAHE